MSLEGLSFSSIGAPRTVQEVVLETLRNAILHGELPPGTKLEQQTIAERLQVSRMPVREALRALEAEGLVVFHPHRGAYVAELSAEEIDEIFSIRAVLEGMAIRLAVPRLTRDELEQVEEIHATMLEIHDDLTLWVQRNNAFHLTLYRAARRARLLAVVEELRFTVQPYVRHYISPREHILGALQEHGEILRACQERDAIRAQHLVEQHLLRVSQALVREFRASRGLSDPMDLMSDALGGSGRADGPP